MLLLVLLIDWFCCAGAPIATAFDISIAAATSRSAAVASCASVGGGPAA